MELFVGNLSFDTAEEDVKKLFAGFGDVVSVVILRRKEKKAPKSRGFGFVQMPDEQQALAAIAALHNKEFMGRVLNVSPARPKPEAPAKSELKEERQPGGYKGGRRTHSYMKRRGLSRMQVEAKPRRSSQDNPMRWRKRKDQAKPWQKSPGEDKPWKKPAGDAKPWSKSSERPQRPRFKGSKNPGGYKR